MILSETGFFQGIESEVMTKITAVSNEEEHPKDTVLFKKGDEAKNLFILKEGTVNLVIKNAKILNGSPNTTYFKTPHETNRGRPSHSV